MAFSFLRRWFHLPGARTAETTQNQACPDGADAQFFLGLKFATGQGAVQDYVRAAECYGLAAEQNHSLAQFNLAMMYGLGQGMLRDEAKSLLWMRRAADLGDAGAQYKLGVQQHLLSRPSHRGAVPEGRIEALKWVRLSAAQGYQGAERACEFVALGMTRDEVAEGGRRAAAFAPGRPSR